VSIALEAGKLLTADVGAMTTIEYWEPRTATCREAEIISSTATH
jgi:hypothetical protein